MKHKYFSAFTLVELIVVITILAILGTIAFVSFQGYSQSARETTRFSDVRTIEKALNLHATQYESLPLPDNKIDILADGEVIGYQGTVGKDVLMTLGQAGEIVDPLDDREYTYYLGSNKTNYQLMAFMEQGLNLASMNPSLTSVSTPFFKGRVVGLIPSVHANEYSERYPRVFGDKMGVITETESNGYTPLQDIVSVQGAGTFDVTDTSGESYVSHVMNTGKVMGDGSKLEIMKTLSQEGGRGYFCKHILESIPDASDGVYPIITSIGLIDVYCDMTTDGGGWTLIASDGNTEQTESIRNLAEIPDTTTAGMVDHLVDVQVNTIGDEMRVVDVNDETNFMTFDLGETWIANKLSLSGMEYGYLYGPNNGFSGGKSGPHKCNYSIMVIGTMGCTTGLNIDYPADGKTLGGVKGSSVTVPTYYGAADYSWQFIQEGEKFRLGWTIPTGNTVYYDNRKGSYLMIR